MKLTILQCIHITIILSSFSLQYLWFYEKISPLQLYHEINTYVPISSIIDTFYQDSQQLCDSATDDKCNDSEGNILINHDHINQQTTSSSDQSSDSTNPPQTNVTDSVPSLPSLLSPSSSINISAIPRNIQTRDDLSVKPDFSLMSKEEIIAYQIECTLIDNNYHPSTHKIGDFWRFVFETLSNNHQFPSSNKEIRPYQTKYFRKKIWGKRPILIELQSIWQKFDRNAQLFDEISNSNNFSNYNPNDVSFVDSILNLKRALLPMNRFNFYESPYILFIKNKIKTPQLNSRQYKQINRTLNLNYTQNELKKSTLVVNNAGVIYYNVARFEQIIMEAFNIPINTNVYISSLRNNSNSNGNNNNNNNENEYSSSVHSDRQDVLILQTQGFKRWQVWSPIIKHPRFEQIRGKDSDSIKESDLKQLKLYYDVILKPGDLLYIPRGFLHQVTMVDENTILDKYSDIIDVNSDKYKTSIHLSLGLELDTLGFTIESFIFCSYGIAVQGGINVEQIETKDGQNVEIKYEEQSLLTYLSGLLWDYSFANEELRKPFPFFEFEYLNNIDNKYKFTNDDISKYYSKFYNKIQNIINKWTVILDENKKQLGEEIDIGKLLGLKISKAHLAQAQTIFTNNLYELIEYFGDRWKFTQARDLIDVVDRNEKFDDLMVDKVMNKFDQCGVPVNIVSDGEEA